MNATGRTNNISRRRRMNRLEHSFDDKQAGNRFARTMRRQWNPKETKIGREVRIKMKDCKTNERQSKLNHRQQCVCPNGPHSQPVGEQCVCGQRPLRMQNLWNTIGETKYATTSTIPAHTQNTIQSRPWPTPVSWITWWRRHEQIIFADNVEMCWQSRC